MSYSFSVRAKSAAEVTAAVNRELDAVTANQPIHARDREAATNAAQALADIITIPEGKELNVSVSGSVGWSGQMGDDVSALALSGAGLNVSISLAEPRA